MVSELNLLPPPDSAHKCSDWNRHIGASAAGTALDVDSVLLVDLPLPWPKPVFAHPRMAAVGLGSMAMTAAGRTRVLARVASPVVDDAPVRARLFVRRDGGATEHHWEGPAEELAQRLTDPTHEFGDEAVPVPAQSTDVLVCVQGSHDVCCGAAGARVADDLEADGTLRVHRVSHLGGHRFAPTAMTLPDGRMWAGLAAAELLAVARGEMEAGEAAAACRGWWGAAAGPAQVAEIAALADFGWQLNGYDRSVEVATDASGTAHHATVTAASPSATHTWRVTVEESRQVPVIACRAMGGLPTKLASEYLATAVERAP